jgi:hypothetical protein
MQGKAREHEVRIMGLTLAALALLAAVASVWAASSIFHHVQAPVSGGSHPQAGLGLVDQS